MEGYALFLSFPYHVKQFLFFFDNRGTFHGQALRTLHGDPNLGIDLPATTSTR